MSLTGGMVKLNIHNAGFEPYQLAVFTAAYSNYRFACLFKAQDTASFQEAHGEFFAFCWGSYQTMVYYNMRVAVGKFVGLHEKEPTEPLIQLSLYFGFRFCTIARGNEKGHVERSVEFVRRKTFSQPGKDCFSSLADANEYLLQECLRLNAAKISNETVPDERFQAERPHLGSELPKFESSRINEKCLETHFKRGTEEETVNYHCNVLEANIYFGEKLIVSIGSEFIENNGEDSECQKKMSAEELKQDCEIKAFKRLAAKIKKKYPRLPITLLADSLYASETVMNICRENRWEFIIRYKVGSIPSIQEEYENISEKEISNHTEYINEIDYNGNPVNMLKYREEKKIKGNVVRTEFQWLTSLKITKKNAEKIAAAGRKRWKIENEGFNRQKNWQGDITHVCSWNEKGLKNYYLMLQISDMIKQLYEWFYLKANEIVKAQKKISSELLASFGRQLTKEDISQRDMHSISDN